MPWWYLLEETYDWRLFSFDFIHIICFYQAHKFLKYKWTKNKRIESISSIVLDSFRRKIKMVFSGCWRSHKNLRLLINTAEAKTEIIVLFMSIVANISSPTTTPLSQLWPAFFTWRMSEYEDLYLLHKPKDITAPNTSVCSFVFL